MRWLADENFNNDIVRGLRRRSPEIDLVRVQDVGLRGLDDIAVLNWAATENRALLTHDVATMTSYAYQRVERGDPMPGVFEVLRGTALGAAVTDILLLDQCSSDDEWAGQIIYLPLR